MHRQIDIKSKPNLLIHISLRKPRLQTVVIQIQHFILHHKTIQALHKMQKHLNVEFLSKDRLKTRVTHEQIQNILM